MIPPGARLEAIVLHNAELRAALRKFMSALAGEEQIESRMKHEGESVDAWNRANRLHAGPKTREEVLDFLVNLDPSLEQFFREYYAEHGCYPDPPDPPDFSKGPWAFLE
jgi:hypothetical protein